MIIDGRALALQLNEQTAREVSELNFKPLLIDVLVGDDPASLSYVKIKQRTAEKFGINFDLVQISEQLNTEQVIEKINEICLKQDLCGLLVQLPLPKHLDEQKILNSVPKKLDVDVLSQASRDQFYKGDNELIPPTAGAIFTILQSLPEQELAGKKFLVLGQGELVGKPSSFLLNQKGFDVSIADSSTQNTRELLLNADCIISGVGKAGLIIGDKIKDGVILIDAGTSEANGSIAGDVDFESCSVKCKFITPVPGGVGPVTVAKLLENVLINAKAT